MKSAIDRIRSLAGHRLEIVYADGLAAFLDFTAFLAEHDGPIVEPLRDEATFSSVRLEHGVATWATGFDICPDVLRFWCEQGCVRSDRGADAHFRVPRHLSAT